MVPTGDGTPLLAVETLMELGAELPTPTSSQASGVLTDDASLTLIVLPGRVAEKHAAAAPTSPSPVRTAPEVPIIAEMGSPCTVPDLRRKRIEVSVPSGATSKVFARSWSTTAPGLTTGKSDES